nr:MAG TPA: hypothetical protein [Caudoviricetes sp.]
MTSGERRKRRRTASTDSFTSYKKKIYTVLLLVSFTYQVLM